MADVSAAAGSYWSGELETRYSLDAAGGSLLLRRRGCPGTRLFPVAPDLFSHDEFWLRFDRGQDGRIDRFRASTGRARGVLFERE